MVDGGYDYHWLVIECLQAFCTGLHFREQSEKVRDYGARTERRSNGKVLC